MARGNYERKILSTHLENFQEQLERSYSRYQEGAYVPVIYYQIDKDKSKVDGSLEVAQNIIGTSSSRKYKKIYDVPLFGLASGLNYEIEFTETAFRSLVGSNAYFIPGTIIPAADDFFTIDRKGLRNHLFKITAIDFNTANPDKYYQISFELYQNPSSEITTNISEEYKFLSENMGSNQNTIIRTADEYLMNKAKETVDILIDKYVASFYDYSYDSFLFKEKSDFRHNSVKYWNPYLIRFLHEYDIVTKYNYDMLTEIFVPEYTEGGYSKWFNDDIWMDSLYQKIVNKDKLDVIDLFTTIEDKNLTKWIKLPFYQSSDSVMLEAFANEYRKNYMLDLMITPTTFQDTSFLNKGVVNLKSIFSNEESNETNVVYLNKKYLLELEYFSFVVKSEDENSGSLDDEDDIIKYLVVINDGRNENNKYFNTKEEALLFAKGTHYAILVRKINQTKETHEDIWYKEEEIIKGILNNSKVGDIYYVYNKNNGYIDNIYRVDEQVDEVGPENRDVKYKNMWFRFLPNYVKDQKVDKTYFFFNDDGTLDSSWKISSDGWNKFFGRFDSNMFGKDHTQIANDVVRLIRNYYNSDKDFGITESILKDMSNMRIRRDSRESFYLIPLVIYILKKFIDRIQR